MAARTKKPTLVLLVRHGQTPTTGTTLPGRAAGLHLADTGRQQAEALRDHLRATGRVKADVLLVSTIPRAIETAQIIAPGLGLEIARHERDLCEVHTGQADGLAWEEYGVRFGGFDMEAEPDRVFAPEGDSWNSFHQRVEDLLHRLAADHPDETVVAVCHAGVILAAMRRLLQRVLEAQAIFEAHALTRLHIETAWPGDGSAVRRRTRVGR